MEWIKPDTHIDFLGKRKTAFVFSSALILLTVVLLIWRGGPNYGVDFAGGILIQVKLEAGKKSDIKVLRKWSPQVSYYPTKAEQYHDHQEGALPASAPVET